MSIILIACLALAVPAAGQNTESDEITVAAVGDIMLGHRAGPYLKRFGPDYPFVHVLPMLRRADCVIGNLECPLSERGTPVPDKQFTLRADPTAAGALASAGIRVVSLANNHILDFGPQALEDTLQALAEHNVVYAGAGMNLEDARAAAFFRIKDRTVAFLSYSLTFPLEFYASAGRPGTAPGYKEYVRADIRKARSRADLVIVAFHWGAELLTAAKDYQRELGRLAVGWGADLVLGTHPHVLQELERYKGRLIAYSLGNFVFGSESDKTNSSIILLCTFKGKSLVRVEAVPIDVNNYRVAYQPRILTGEAGKSVLEGLSAASAKFGARLDIRGDGGAGILDLTASPGN